MSDQEFPVAGGADALVAGVHGFTPFPAVLPGALGLSPLVRRRLDLVLFPAPAPLRALVAFAFRPHRRGTGVRIAAEAGDGRS